VLLHASEAVGLREESRTFPSWTLRPRQLCDLELLLNGGFTPLTGFLGPADHARVVSEMRLADGALWPIQIVLDVDERFATPSPAGTASPSATPRASCSPSSS